MLIAKHFLVTSIFQTEFRRIYNCLMEDDASSKVFILKKGNVAIFVFACNLALQINFYKASRLRMS